MDDLAVACSELVRSHDGKDEFLNLLVAQKLESSSENGLEGERVTNQYAIDQWRTYLNHLDVQSSVPSEDTVFAEEMRQRRCGE